MKYPIPLVLIILLIACNQQNKKSDLESDTTVTTIPISENEKIPNGIEICWRGYLNDKIPVFLHYQIKDSIAIGEIIYLNTKAKRPIKVIGTIDSDNSYRLLEFDKKGTITGIISGTPSNKNFNGSWFSPKTRKDLEMKLVASDSVIKSTPMEISNNNIYGNYYYQYSKGGSTGNFKIDKVNKNKSAFEIFSVTDAPSRNMAIVNKDTINFNKTKFIYHVPGSKKCKFFVHFYKDFVYIDYTDDGYCIGQFGFGATVDGIFLKMK